MWPPELVGGVSDAGAEAALAYPEPRRRYPQIYAVDPMIARLSGNEVVTITVPYEPLLPGPSGDLVQVVDSDREHETVSLGVGVGAGAAVTGGPDVSTGPFGPA